MASIAAQYNEADLRLDVRNAPLRTDFDLLGEQLHVLDLLQKSLASAVAAPEIAHRDAPYCARIRTVASTLDRRLSADSGAFVLRARLRPSARPAPAFGRPALQLVGAAAVIEADALVAEFLLDSPRIVR